MSDSQKTRISIIENKQKELFEFMYHLEYTKSIILDPNNPHDFIIKQNLLKKINKMMEGL